MPTAAKSRSKKSPAAQKAPTWTPPASDDERPLDDAEEFVAQRQWSPTAWPAPGAVSDIPEDRGATPPDIRFIPLEQLVESKRNPRKHFDPGALQELADQLAVRQLANLLVRPHPDKEGVYEIAAGHRRRRAAPIAGLTGLWAEVRAMDNVEFMWVLMIENLGHRELTPLEEARGLADLMKTAGEDVHALAARLKRGTRTVYDKLSLLKLIPALQAFLESGEISESHGVELARLSAEEQQLVMGTANGGGYDEPYSDGGLFKYDEPHLTPEQEELLDEKTAPPSIKAVSLIELKRYIAEHVRFNEDKINLQMEFPETAQLVEEARSLGMRRGKFPIVKITHLNYVDPDARSEEEKVIGPKSWKRADGQFGSKTCDFAMAGVINVGPGWGTGFPVCVNKKKCKTHWPEQFAAEQRRIKEAEKETKSEAKSAGPKSNETAVTRQKKEQERVRREEEADRQREKAADAKRQRWTRALPALLEALADKIKKTPAGARSDLAGLVIKEIVDRNRYHVNVPSVARLTELVARGSTAEDAIRHAAFIAIGRSLNIYDEAGMVKLFKDVGLDAQKIVDAAAPEKVQTPAKPVAKTSAPAKAKAKKPAAKKPAKKAAPKKKGKKK